MNDRELANLVRRAKAKDADAYDTIIDHWGPRLYGFFVRVAGSRDDAEDLLQELFLRVLRSIDGYEHTNQFESWLFRIAGNLVRDRMRRVRRTPTSMSLDDDGSGEADAAVAANSSDASGMNGSRVEAGEQFDALDRALARLNDSERQVVMLRHFSALSFAQIAEMMQSPIGTVLAQGHRGLAKLREMMESQR